MKIKRSRQQGIEQILSSTVVHCQEDLLNAMKENGFAITQATLSRDLREMRVLKVPDVEGGYLYQLPLSLQQLSEQAAIDASYFPKVGILSLEFSGTMAVLKTRPGYASGVASDIDSADCAPILGTIAGDDTVLIVIREGADRNLVKSMLNKVLNKQDEDAKD